VFSSKRASVACACYRFDAMRTYVLPLIMLPLVAACPETVPNPVPGPDTTKAEWRTVATKLPSALLSVSAPSDRQVIAVGADKGAGPLVLRFDGTGWSELKTGFRGDLWWVHSFASGPSFMAGQNAQVLKLENGMFTRVPTPGLAKQTIYGLWGKTPTDLYAVGGAAGRDGFVWHWDGTAFSNVALPVVPLSARGEVPGLFKVWGRGDEVWVVGGNGLILHRTGQGPLEVVPSGTTETLFTVAGRDDTVLAVGGSNAGVLLERAANGTTFEAKTPAASALIQGVFAGAQSDFAVGERGQIFERARGGAFEQKSLPVALSVQSLHAVTSEPGGQAWAVGGNVLTPTLDEGVLLHYGKTAVPTWDPNAAQDGGTDTMPPAMCPPEIVTIAKGKSIARRWDEQIMASIRRDLPRPTVHARNLYHLSAAMWDAWAAYDNTARGVFVREKTTAANVDTARAEAISYAAYRILTHRYMKAVGGAVSVACYSAVMRDLGYDAADSNDVGDAPRALGNRIGKTIIAQSAMDGAYEETDYKDPTPSTNPNFKTPLIIDEPGIGKGVDPDLWQPLNLSVAATQNGIILPAGVQGYIGSAWGGVRPFAMKRASEAEPWQDVGPAPKARDAATKNDVVEVIQRSHELDPNDGVLTDISPAGMGNNPLGSNAGTGYPVNPITGQPYTVERVKRGDFGRVLAEYWADGPKSETPPGHWNVLANHVADSPALTRRLYGAGASLDALSWDVHVYLALNGAVHDAAIAAWDLKRRSESARPLTLIRWMAQNGQSSDPAQPSYSTDGLPLVPGLIELITAETVLVGARHAHLRAFVGQIAIHAWIGEPGDRTTQVSGAGWQRGMDWLPYQRRNFVTPAFPGFISGHSTFSRAAAEVLARLTGSEYFPGGFCFRDTS
jgi:hypothetical protein